MNNPNGGANWPKDNQGEPMPTAKDPLSGVMMCQQCWCGCHPRNGCTNSACKCGCYKGRNKSTSGLVRPKEGQDNFLDSCGSIEIS